MELRESQARDEACWRRQGGGHVGSEFGPAMRREREEKERDQNS